MSFLSNLERVREEDTVILCRVRKSCCMNGTVFTVASY